LKAAAAAGPTVVCPTCKGPALFAPANAWRPFCSERCRTTDLGAWASEQFRVPGPPQDGAEPTSEPHAH
jgi:uncharacterized protein